MRRAANLLSGVAGLLALSLLPVPPAPAAEAQPRAETRPAAEALEEAWPEDLGARETVLETAYFTFYSHFGFNLYDALLTAGTAQLKGEEDAFQASKCFTELGDAQRAGWKAAMDYFAATVAGTSGFSAERYVLRSYLADLGTDFSSEAQEYRHVSLLLLRAAAPAYRPCRWAEQDATNRRWAAELAPRLEEHAEEIARRITGWFGVSWRQLPIPVDLVETSGWAGADTVGQPVSHIQMSTTNPGYQGVQALEMVFHEASHELIGGRNGPIAEMLREASKETGVEIPRSLWHGLLFITAGEATRHELEASGEGPYVPYAEAHEIFRGSWQPFEKPLRDHWLPYLRGETSAPEALRRVLLALNQPVKS